MKKLENVQVGVTEEGMACGPEGGIVVAEVCVSDAKGKKAYHSLIEMEGCPTFLDTDESAYEQLLKAEDEELGDELSGCITGEYGDYFEAFEEMEELGKEEALIRRYLVYMVRADWEDVEKLKKISVGQRLDTFKIPKSDVEEEYLEETEE